MMSKEGNFLIYCIERYKSAKGLTGRQVSELFTKYRVWDYIYSCFALYFFNSKQGSILKIKNNQKRGD